MLRNEKNVPGSLQVISRDLSIPAFIGYTEKASRNKRKDLHLVPVNISSIGDYELYFGKAYPEKKALTVNINLAEIPVKISAATNKAKQSPYLLYYSVKMYFANGGQECLIISTGPYSRNRKIDPDKLLKALSVCGHQKNASVISFPDAINIDTSNEYYRLVKETLRFCTENPPRFFVGDLYPASGQMMEDLNQFRNQEIGEPAWRKRGALYYPLLYFIEPLLYEEREVAVIYTGKRKRKSNLADLKTTDGVQYTEAVAHIQNLGMLLASAPAVIAKYQLTERSLGIWKSPSNMTLDSILKLSEQIGDSESEYLTVDPKDGKSVNAIRSFAGKGNAIIWGGRTLAGNDPEWKYINLVRLSDMISVSVESALGYYRYENMHENTYSAIRTMAENFLHGLWRQGALAGQKPEQGFFVRVGAGETMTDADIEAGRINLLIGFAPVRPAEFMILNFGLTVLVPSIQNSEETEQSRLRRNKRLISKLRLNNNQHLNSVSNRFYFYGDDEPEKLAAAYSLAALSGQELFRIDLNQLISKYIGETEKNLDRLFEKAEEKKWILIFDESEQLFGKRTKVKDAHDRYANPEVAYLTEKIHSYNGKIIICSAKRKTIPARLRSDFKTLIAYNKNTS